MKTTTLEQEEEQARNTAETQGATVSPAPEQVARLAYRYWEERGKPLGTPEEDWFRAEQDLRGRAA